MDDLLKAYELEIVQLRLLSGEFARRYPKVAGKLQIASDVCADPHVERLIQSVALIAARVSKRLDDDYPQFTERLLDVLHPHYMRPFPSCAIVRFDMAALGAGDASSNSRVSRGSIMESAAVQGVRCRFRTIYDVVDAPVRVVSARFTALITAPASVRLPVDASASIDIDIERSTDVPLDEHACLRLFVDGEASFSATLLDTLFLRTVCAHLELDDGSWVALPTIPLRRAGLSDEDMLMPFDARSHKAYRVLTEYFAFPEKFNFLDIDLGVLVHHAGTDFTRVKLHLSCAGVRADSNVARMLRGLSSANFLTGCTPAVNLFAQNGVPIAVTGLTVDYSVLAHAQHPHGYEIYSIDSVQMVRQHGGTSTQTEFRPFYSLRHGEDASQGGHYWVMRHDDTLAAVSPGFEKRLTLVDADLAMLAREKRCISLMLSCTNRDLPSRLKTGQREGDLKLINGVMHAPIRFLRRPSPTYRFPAGSGEHWRLFSHLTLNHHSLVQEGLSAVREMLTLYDLPQSASSQRLIAGIVGLDYADSATWMRRGLGPCLVHGIEVRITIDEEAFVGSGVHLFIEVIDQFLGLYVQHNSFVQLVVLSQQTGKEIKRCKPRNGYQQLV